MTTAKDTREPETPGQVPPVVHTPGPWMHELELDHTGQETLEVMEVDGHQMRIVSWDKSCISATDIANARLIAAAPELLLACENYVYGRKSDRECEPKMMAAIVKARG